MGSENNAQGLRVMEMFAGVGGFRLGLQRCGVSGAAAGSAYRVVWSNQFEPGTKRQHASEVYVARWGSDGHSNEDIFDVVSSDDKFAAIEAAAPEMLVGGFPCQDYSVASSNAVGLEGKKGVLWWSIYRTLKRLLSAAKPVKFLMLENVDRLLASPTKCRGRDFAMILSSLASLGYAAEWRVVNSAQYGFAQRRKRVFILAYHSSTALYADASKHVGADHAADWLTTHGVLAHALPAVLQGSVASFELGSDPLQAQLTYVPTEAGASRLDNTGVMVDGRVYTAETTAAPISDYTAFVGQSQALTLGDVVKASANVPESFYLSQEALPKWAYLKGKKCEPRTAASGHEYTYCEGAVTFPDELTRPSRTVITGEGGDAASRFKHVIRTPGGRLRRLMPEELEALNDFPQGFTDVQGVSDTKRAFLMGNALVVGIVRLIGQALAARLGSATGDGVGH